MPAKSKKQQMAAGAAFTAKRGERPVSSLKGASRQMAQSMSEKQLQEFAHTRRRVCRARRLDDHRPRATFTLTSGTACTAAERWSSRSVRQQAEPPLRRNAANGVFTTL